VGDDGRPPAAVAAVECASASVHPAVWCRVKLADSLSIAELHRVIQLLIGGDNDHLLRFRIHGRNYGIAYINGPGFGEDEAAVPLSRFRFHPTVRFLYEQDFRGLRVVWPDRVGLWSTPSGVAM
jgi:Plasmid pRiA4b ORF-3-like protein